MKLKKGSIVVMTEEYKKLVGYSNEHIQEFGDCIGIVEDQARSSNFEVWPEYNVRWQPSNLRYMYDPDYLLVLEEPNENEEENQNS